MRGAYPLLYKDGEVIFEEDSAGKEIYIIESGKVEISKSVNGDSTRIALLEKGEFFGEMAPITGVVRSATAIAVGDTYLVPFSMDEMFERMQHDPKFMLSVLRRLISRLRNTTSELRDLTLRLYRLDSSASEGRFQEEQPLPDIAEEKTVPEESYRMLQKMVSHLEQQIQDRDKHIEDLQKQMEDMKVQMEKFQRRGWLKRS